MLETHKHQILLRASRSATLQHPVSDHKQLLVFKLRSTMLSNFLKKLFFPRSDSVGITILVKLCKPLGEQRAAVYLQPFLGHVAHELVQDNLINKIDAFAAQVKCHGVGLITASKL